jgi:hypothetical protein
MRAQIIHCRAWPANSATQAHKTHVTEKAVELDKHRGMAAQKATDLRRLLAEVETNEKALRATQEELETQLIAAPALN